MKTKMVLTVLGLATLVATPALAQKPTHRAANAAYAAAVRPAPVVSNGAYVGTDPDPSIRFELERPWSTYMGGTCPASLPPVCEAPGHARGFFHASRAATPAFDFPPLIR